MTLTILVSADTHRWLAAQAATAGTTAEAFAAEVLEKTRPREKTFAEVAAPFAQSFAESGMTEEELATFLVQELADMRREKREAGR